MSKKRKSKINKKLNTKKISKTLGAEVINDQKDKEEFEKRYGWPRPLIPQPKSNNKK